MVTICFHYDMNLTRRRILQLGGATVASGLAGCSTSSGKQSSKTLLLGRLEVVNHDPRPHTVHAVFLDGKNPVYWVSKKVDAADDLGAGYTKFENYPTQPGNDVLHVRTDSQPKSDWERLDFGDRNGPCLSLEIGIGDKSGNSPGDVTIWESSSSQACDGMTTTKKKN